jgi:hypothetical protein
MAKFGHKLILKRPNSQKTQIYFRAS